MTEAKQLQEDLIHAFSAHEFQLQLLHLRQARPADAPSFMAAMRDTAMVAQKNVLQKYNYPENSAGVQMMVGELTYFFIMNDCLSPREASAKAKALSVGMASATVHRWRWPKPSVDDSASTTCPSEGDVLGSLSDVECED